MRNYRVRRVKVIVTLGGCALIFAVSTSARFAAALGQGSQIPQGDNTQNWPTVNADPLRDGWVRSDPHISTQSITKMSGFGLVRKAKLGPAPSTARLVSQ